MTGRSLYADLRPERIKSVVCVLAILILLNLYKFRIHLLVSPLKVLDYTFQAKYCDRNSRHPFIFRLQTSQQWQKTRICVNAIVRCFHQMINRIYIVASAYTFASLFVFPADLENDLGRGITISLWRFIYFRSSNLPRTRSVTPAAVSVCVAVIFWGENVFTAKSCNAGI